MSAAPQPFAVGDRLRVIVDEPYSTELKTNDIVTVTALTKDVNDQILYVVSTAYGPQLLYPDAVQLFDRPDDYTPAEPDSVTDAQFAALMNADPELLNFNDIADTALAAEDAKLSPALSGDTAVMETAKPGWTRPESPEEHFHMTDADGEELDVYYAEQQCPEHGREGMFFLQINDDDVVEIPAALMPRLILFLHNRTMYSRRPQTDD